MGLVVRCCLLVACFVAGVPAWPCGLLLCCSLWFVVVPCSLVLCPVLLCCRVVLCCGVLQSVLLCWWCLFVLCPVLGRGAALPCCAACVLLSVALRAVVCGACRAALCCAVLARLSCFPVLCSFAFVVLVGVLWCCLWSLVVHRRLSLFAGVSCRCVAALASLVLPCCVLRCVVVPRYPVRCPVVLCCLVVLCCRALLVLGGLLLSVLSCWWRLFVYFSLKTSAKPVKKVFHF